MFGRDKRLSIPGFDKRFIDVKYNRKEYFQIGTMDKRINNPKLWEDTGNVIKELESRRLNTN